MYHRFYSRHFKQQLKSLVKKYPSLSEDILDFFDSFAINQAVSLGKNLYKVRIACRSLNKGKSGGFRLITLIFLDAQLLVPVTMYFKGDFEDIEEEELLFHAQIVRSELEDQHNFTFD